MTPELAYFLKVNVAIALFYAFYRLLFYKDTFFHWRRAALLCFFAISLLYPLLNIQGWIKAHEPMVAIADLYATMLPEYTITPQQGWAMGWTDLIRIIYWGGVLFLATRFFIQLGSIIRLHVQCKRSTIQGTRVHLLKKENSPFSFFRWIFIHPESHPESETDEIITHETTHADQHHSIDVLVSELMCIACWFNPFAWLIKREVRGNLEYLADHRVLETGHDSKSYQYHLLGLAHHKAAAKLSNSFNVLPLKNRIKMMNKPKTREIGRTKYLVFLPLATLLMIVSNIEMVARTTERLAQEVSNQTISVATVQDSIPFETVEEMPEFPGGQQALINYVSKNLRYPAEAHAKGIQGRVIASFVVLKDGSIADIKVVRGVDFYLDKEAVRVITAMPKWKPGKQKGEAVNVKYTIPVTFKLTGPDTPKAEKVKASNLDEVAVVGYTSAQESRKADEEKPFTVVDVMPKFPGGTSGLMKYLAQSVKYPPLAMKNKEQGKVIVRMVVGKDGNLSNIKVLRGVSPLLDAEAIRVVSAMPKWEPGQHKGQAVNVEYALPIMFRLQ